MAVRTTKSSITFHEPFNVKGRDTILSPGCYEIETEEEIIEGNGRTVYRRIAIRLYVQSGGMTQAITIDPKDWAYIGRRCEPSKEAGPDHRDSSQTDAAIMSKDEVYHLNRQPHERMLAAETADPQTRAAHLKLAKMHGKMAGDARNRADQDRTNS